MRRGNGPTPMGVVAIIVIILAFIGMAYVEALPKAGDPCSWDSDCAVGEKCVSVQKGWNQPKICLPDDFYDKPDPIKKDTGVGD